MGRGTQLGGVGLTPFPKQTETACRAKVLWSLFTSIVVWVVGLTTYYTAGRLLLFKL